MSHCIQLCSDYFEGCTVVACVVQYSCTVVAYVVQHSCTVVAYVVQYSCTVVAYVVRVYLYGETLGMVPDSTPKCITPD